MAAALLMDVEVLRKLQDKRTAVPRYYASGHTDRINYVVMQLLGRSVLELKKATNEDRFSFGTRIRLVEQMTRALRDLHECGYLHRDVKPANFTIGPALQDNEHRMRIVYMIDFAPIPGSAPRQLPWRRMNEKKDILESKLQWAPADLLPVDSPAELQEVINHLSTLEFDTTPNYGLISDALTRSMHGLQIDGSTPWDWDPVDQNGDQQRVLQDSKSAGSEASQNQSVRTGEKINAKEAT